MRFHPSIIAERLLRDGTLYCIDMLPQRVPEHSRGQFFAVEKYYMSGPYHERLFRQFGEVLLKLNCYHDLLVEDLLQRLWQGMDRSHFYALVDDGDALIVTYGGDTYMSIYGASSELLELVETLVTAAGVYLR